MFSYNFYVNLSILPLAIIWTHQLCLNVIIGIIYTSKRVNRLYFISHIKMLLFLSLYPNPLEFCTQIFSLSTLNYNCNTSHCYCIENFSTKGLSCIMYFLDLPTKASTCNVYIYPKENYSLSLIKDA